MGRRRDAKQIGREDRPRRDRSARRRARTAPSATLVLIVLGALVLVVLGAAIFGADRHPESGGRVWSPEHGHWH